MSHTDSRGPLRGRHVVVTRAREQAGDLIALLERQGAAVLALPCIAIEPPDDPAPLDDALRRFPEFDWVVFSSTNGVERFLARLAQQGREAGALRGVRIAAVGPATARALESAGLRADLVPKAFHAEGLAAALVAQGIRGRRVLQVRAQEGRDLLPQTLRSEGAQVELVAAYKTVTPKADPAPLRQWEREGKLSAVVFASPSAVRGFFTLLGPEDAERILSRVAAAAIGPVTARALSDRGVEVGVAPRDSTAEALVEALVAFFSPASAEPPQPP